MIKEVKLTKSAKTVLEKRYLVKDDKGRVIETPEQMFRRVAHHLANAEYQFGKNENEAKDVEEKFYEMMATLEFVPNSPCLMNAGRPLGQLAACFVLPVGDSLEDIFTTVKQAALIHQSGGGTGFAFSRLRPRGDIVKSTRGVSSGPISFMEVINAATEAIKQGGTRRGANMGILRVDHPDIMEFITCKKDHTKITNFNISVAVTEKFMDAVEKDEEYELLNPRTKDVVKKMRAKEVFDKLVQHAWENGDPGIVFIDRINKTHPTPHVGEIESTNPCGEQPLMPYESCNLGSIDLGKMLDKRDNGYALNWDKIKERVHLAIRFLDNVVEMNKYPVKEIEEVTKANRRVGLGVMGWADMLIHLGISYCSEEALELAERIMSFIDSEAKKTSHKLAEERGPFKNFKGSIYDKPGHPTMRNSTVTTIAPTGTIGIIAGCSQGIEPLFALAYIRKTGLAGNIGDVQLTEVNEIFLEVAKERGFYSEGLMKKIAVLGSVQGLKEVPEDVQKAFVTAHDISPEWHLRTQAAFQKYVDNAVSKTVNFPHDATAGDVAKVYQLAYHLNCKGVTVYRDGSRMVQVLNVGHGNGNKTEEKNAEAIVPKAPSNVDIALTGGNGDMLHPQEVNSVIGPERFAQHILAESDSAFVSASGNGNGNGKSIRVEPRPRPDVSEGMTAKIMTGCGKLYVTVNSDEHGPVELFAQLGKSGGCIAAHTEATGRLASLALQAGIDPQLVAQQLKGIRCPRPALDNGEFTLSCADGVGKALQRYLDKREQQTKPESARAAAAHAVATAMVAASSAISKQESHVKTLAGNCPECPECGQMLEFQEGCVMCKGCGYSQCG